MILFQLHDIVGVHDIRWPAIQQLQVGGRLDGLDALLAAPDVAPSSLEPTSPADSESLLELELPAEPAHVEYSLSKSITMALRKQQLNETKL